MKRITKVLVCMMLVIGLVYSPVYIPVLEQTPAVAVADAATVKLSKKSAVLRTGDTLKLKVKNTKKKIVWSSSNQKVATVTKKGLVKAKAVGKAKITAKIGKKKLVCNVTVKKRMSVNVKSLTFEDTMKPKKVKLTFVGEGSVNYSIADSDVATGEWAKKWNGNSIYLTVTPYKAGNTTLTFTNSLNKEKLVLKIKVINREWDVDAINEAFTYSSDAFDYLDSAGTHANDAIYNNLYGEDYSLDVLECDWDLDNAVYEVNKLKELADTKKNLILLTSVIDIGEGIDKIIANCEAASNAEDVYEKTPLIIESMGLIIDIQTTLLSLE